MKVTFADLGAQIASSRLRARIPQEELGKLGIPPGNDVLIYGKHVVSEQQTTFFKKLVFDICDDHFSNPDLRAYYIRHSQMANVITCNSEVMKQRIKEETGRDAIIVKEPYECSETEPDIGPLLLWFGHKSNLKDLERIAPRLKHDLMVLTNHDDYPEWTPENFKEAISTPCMVIIPTGKSQAKSENRMVESIRSGRYVCAEYLPAYEPFSCFFPLGDIPESIERALSNPQDSIERIRAAQDYIRDRYSPQTIARQWLEVLKWL